MGGSVDESGVNWSEVFDVIASEYGYTWLEFIGLTYIQLNECLECIARRRHENIRIMAMIHGVTINAYEGFKPPKKEDLKAADDLIEKILKEKGTRNG